MDQFKKRIEAIFRDYTLSDDYREAPTGRHNEVPSPWVEFGLNIKKDGFVCAEITYAQLKALSRLLGTEEIEIDGQFGGSLPNHYLWITAYGVNFVEKLEGRPDTAPCSCPPGYTGVCPHCKWERKERALRELLPKAKSNSEVRRIAIGAGLDPSAMVREYGNKETK